MGSILERLRAEQEERINKTNAELAEQEKKLGLDLTKNKTYEATASKMMSEVQTDELDDESRTILGQMMRGQLASSTPDRSFDDIWSERMKSSRPAMIAVQDGIRAMLAGRTGQKFVSVRDQAFNEYTTLKKLQLDKQQQDQQAQNQLAITARTIVNAQKTARARALSDALRAEKNEQMRLRYSQELQVELGLKTREQVRQENLLDLENQKFAQKVQQDQRFKDNKGDLARDLALINIKSMQPEFPDDLQALNPEQAKFFQEEFNKAYKTVNPPKAGGSSPSFRYIPVEDGYGTSEYYAFDSKNPANSFNVETGEKLYPIVKLSEDQKKGRDAANSFWGTSRIVADAVMTAEKNPIGAQRLIPEAALQAFGLIGFDARQVERGYKQMILEAQRRITGAQATDAERNFIKALFPATYGSDPHLFVNDLMFTGIIGKLSAIRTSAGMLDKVDLREVSKKLYSYYAEASKAGQYGEILSDEQLRKLLEDTAADQGYKLIKDSHGRFRDAVPLSGEEG